ncbi:unnamed protein product [Rotaria sordida]|uniref:Uncharacterized protein n=1 Tax=Rotaria sordida TaxID=392033 RepID=A0A813QED8_9BILA|nr:unnamed protein product [Rotaria sordida]CAF0837473.1 unnamed protein product [Rotaria sordida]CAF3537394.1 unnamed protein product [Rotaria sordida]CAF3750465.1 unnamed protein product [Rotaria sordida]
MEVNNRFQLFTFLSTDEESEKSSFIDLISSDQISEINDKQQTKNHWDVPEYVEKPIPSSSVPITQVQTSRIIKKTKSSVNVTNTKCDKQDEVKSSPIIEEQNQPTTCSYYPPQPYKFKQNSLNQRNQTIPKFNRKMNVLPKHSSIRGNSKACTHQI